MDIWLFCRRYRLKCCCIRDKSLVYELVDRETVGQYTGLTDKNGKKSNAKVKKVVAEAEVKDVSDEIVEAGEADEPVEEAKEEPTEAVQEATEETVEPTEATETAEETPSEDKGE